MVAFNKKRKLNWIISHCSVDAAKLNIQSKCTPLCFAVVEQQAYHSWRHINVCFTWTSQFNRRKLSDYKGRGERQPHQATDPACEQGFVHGSLMSFITGEVATFLKDKKWNESPYWLRKSSCNQFTILYAHQVFVLQYFLLFFLAFTSCAPTTKMFPATDSWYLMLVIVC